jgi:DNA-binding transcriptional LysR family regulator
MPVDVGLCSTVMDVELRHLRAIAAIGDLGSITAAAVTLHVAQPALSRTLSQLENRLGTRLVDRTTRRLELTAAGRVLWEHAHRILRSVDEAIAATTSACSQLRVGFSWSALGSHTVALMRTWKAEQPDTALVFRRVDDPELALRTGKIDVAFFRSTPGASTLQHVVLGYEQRLAAVAADDSLSRRDELTLNAIATRRVALCATAASADLGLWPPDQQPDRTVVVGNVDEWLATIAAGDTAGLTSESTEYSHPHPGIRYVPVAGVGPVPVFLSWPADNSHPMIKTFVSHASQLLRTSAAPARQHQPSGNRHAAASSTNR